tara:strand:- start:14942 stop:15391 length:450 start_codon:yes stop_codon:yes gene_type:complete
LKDKVKRELVEWNDVTQRIFFDAMRGLPEDVKRVILFEMTTQRLAEIASHKDERLIRATFNSVIELTKSRKALLGVLAKKIGASENHSELDMQWVLRYGMSFFDEYVQEQYQIEREKVYSRLMNSGIHNRILHIIDNNEEHNLDDQSEQ